MTIINIIADNTCISCCNDATAYIASSCAKFVKLRHVYVARYVRDFNITDIPLETLSAVFYASMANEYISCINFP